MLSFQTRQEPLIYDQVALIVSPSGDIDDRSVRQFEQQLQDYLRVGYRFLILNCAGLRGVNSGGLEVLLKMIETFNQESGGIFLLIQVQSLPQISKFFDMLGFSPIFTSFTSKQEAISYLNGQIKAAFEADKDKKPDAPVQDSPVHLSKEKLLAAAPVLAVSASPHSTAPTPSPVTSAPVAEGRESSLAKEAKNEPRAELSKAEFSKPDSAKAEFPKAEYPKMERPVSEKRIPVSDISVDMEIRYFKQMRPFTNYELVALLQPVSNNPTGSAVQVMPFFPGCLVVPEYRVAGLKEKENLTFWITPLAYQKIHGWLELRYEEGGCSLPINAKVRKSRLGKWFLLAALASSFLFFCPKAPWLDAIHTARQAFSQYVPVGDLGWWMTGTALLLAFLSYWLSKPGRAKITTSQTLTAKKQ